MLGSLLFILLAFGVDALFVRFLLIGELPGSNSSLSPITMLTIYSASFAIILIYLFVPRTQINEFGKRAQSIKTRLPRKRFSSL